jgi:trigger factor
MNIERKDIDGVNTILTVQIEKNDYQETVEKKLRNYRQKANIPGFRPGNVPMSLVKKMYGKAIMAEEVNRLISEKLYSYIQENNIRILGEPLPNVREQKDIDFDTQDNFEFVFDIGIAPEFDVELNKKVTIPYYNIQVDDVMMENAVKSYTGRFGSYKQEDTVEENDIIKGNIVELSTNGKEKEGGIKVEDAVLSPKYMKDTDQKALFVGAKKDGIIVFNPKKAFGSESEISSLLKISKEEAAEIISDFQVTIKEITRYKEGELNQELFDKAFGEGTVKSEEEFKQKIEDEIKTSLNVDSDYKLMIDARDTLVKRLEDLQFPDSFLKRWLLATNENKRTEEELNAQYPKMIEDLKWHLIKEKIANDKEIKIEEADLTAYAKKAAQAQFAQYGMMGMPDDVLENYAKDMLKNKDTVKNLVDRVMDEKILDVIKSSVKLSNKKVSLDKFNKMFEEEKEAETENK